MEEQSRLFEQYSATRISEFERQGISEASLLGEAQARLDTWTNLSESQPTMAEIAPTELLDATRGLLDSAIESGSFDAELGAKVERLESTMLECWENRQTGELAMDELVESGALEIRNAVRKWDPDGRRATAIADFGGPKRQMPFAVRTDQGQPGRTVTIDFEASRSNITGPDSTQAGACAEQERLVRGIGERVDLELEGERAGKESLGLKESRADEGAASGP
jgi:hypothetical protein